MNNLRLIRKKRKLTQEKLAKLCNTTQRTISNWEIGRCEIDFKHLKLLSNIFNISIDEIIGNSSIENSGFPTFTNFNKDLIEQGFSIEKYENLKPSQKLTLLKIIITAIQGFN